MIDGSPSGPRSLGSSSSSRSKNCSVNRTCRLSTLPTLCTQDASCVQYFRLKWLRNVAPSFYRRCPDRIRTGLRAHKGHLSSGDGSDWFIFHFQMYLSSSGRAVFATRPVEGLVLVGWSETRRLLKFSLGTREVLADFEQVPVDNRAERLVQKTKFRRSEKGAFPTSQLGEC